MTSLLIDGVQTPTTKVCKGCAQELELGQFYRHPMMGDGHLNYCKSCVKGRVAEHRLKNIERIRDYDRNRPNKQERQAKAAVITKRRREEVPGYALAHNRVAWAKKMGRLVVPSACELCGSETSLVAHHDDYSRPLDVTWMCHVCHVDLHLKRDRCAA